MTADELQIKLEEFIAPAYPHIQINVIDTPDNGHQIYFVEKKFQHLYPLQRYHYLIHLIPEAFYNEHLAASTWFELAPDENPEDLHYLDKEDIAGTRDIILDILQKQTGFARELDVAFCAESIQCYGDFRHSQKILHKLDFSEQEQFDIFHVLMHEGGFCDCEILYNVFRDSKYAQIYRSQK